MRVLVVGGSGSGKSAYAEKIACELSDTRTYVATMKPIGAEARKRIARHRMQRANKGFELVECTESLTCALPSSGHAQGVALLDDLGNLVANTLFAPDGTMRDPTRVLERLTHELDGIAQAYEHVVVVGNEVGSEGPYPQEATQTWVRLVGTLCCVLAARSNTVVEVTAGVPCSVKGWAT